MKISVLPRLILAGLCAVLAACTTELRPPGAPEAGLTVLDNGGGFAHQGRRITLHADGRFEQMLYTDVRGPEHDRVMTGTYRFSEDRKLLTLVAPSGGEQILYREPHGGKVYWVKSGERVRIHEADEEAERLRNVSLRTEKR